MFINETGIIGLVVSAGTTTLTGNLMLSLLVILIFLILIAIMFGIQLEYISIIIFPFCLACASYYQNFLIPLLVIIIYISTLVAKHWLFK